jgi:hypothetical protein
MSLAWTRVPHGKMQMSGTRSPHTADTCRKDPHRQAHHIQRWTAINRRGHVHVTHKDAGTGCTGNTQARSAPGTDALGHAGISMLHKDPHTPQTGTPDKDPRRHQGDMLRHAIPNRHSKDQRATKNPVDTNITEHSGAHHIRTCLS